MTEYNVYCDESCHLENDGNDIFVLGGVVCPKTFSKSANQSIINLKTLYGFDPRAEIKWTKISNSNVDFYLDLIKLFFDNENLSFRGYVGMGKTELSHDRFHQTYDDWYYKMYYRMLQFIFDSHTDSSFNVFLDIKDTVGGKKIRTLQNYFNSHYGDQRVAQIQLVRSDEIALLQLNDVLIGALSYKHRGLKTSAAKLRIIESIEDYAKSDLLLPVSYRKKKANWFVWTPSDWR